MLISLPSTIQNPSRFCSAIRYEQLSRRLLVDNTAAVIPLVFAWSPVGRQISRHNDVSWGFRSSIRRALDMAKWRLDSSWSAAMEGKYERRLRIAIVQSGHGLAHPAG